jgi:hypothetical protein
MNPDEFVEAIEEMDPETLASNFEALFNLALSIEEAEQPQGETDETG